LKVHLQAGAVELRYDRFYRNQRQQLLCPFSLLIRNFRRVRFCAGNEAEQLPLIKALAANLDCAHAVDATDEETNLRSLTIQGMAKLLIFDRMGTPVLPLS
jgi:hypothetical protein